MTLRLALLMIGVGSVIPLTGFMTLRWMSMGRDWVTPTVTFGILNAVGTVACLGVWKAIGPRMRLSAGAWLVVTYLLLAIPLSVMTVIAEHRGLWSESAVAIQFFASLFMMSLFVIVSPLTLLILIGGAPIASQTALLGINVAMNAVFYFVIGLGFQRWVLKQVPHG